MEKVKLNVLSDIFKVFQNREEYFDKLKQSESGWLIILKHLMVVSLLVFVYGFIMGVYHSPLQGVVAGIKLIILFLSTLIICFPSFYIIQLMLGSAMKLKEVALVILSGFLLTSIIIVSFAPIIIFFWLTGSSYHFLQLLHVAVFIFAGLFGVRLTVAALKHACEKENVYPQTGVTVFKVWIVIFAFVGIQLAWNLRPFVGDKGEGFTLFRDYKGNFYTALIYSFQHLSDNHKEDINSDLSPPDNSNDTIENNEDDTLSSPSLLNQPEDTL